MFDGLGDMVATLIIVLAVIAFAFGAFAMWVIPIIWEWVKPIIHSLTA